MSDYVIYRHVKNELEKNIEGRFRVLTEVLSRHLPGGLKKTTKNLSRDIGALV
jgi:hypothetical protein